MMTNRNPLAVVLIVLLTAGIGNAFYLGIWYWTPGPTFDGSTSGVWMALAVDAAHGIFYRPILSDLGYGGTRYVPVFFLLYGTLISAGIDPTLAGILLMQASTLLLVLAVFTVLIRIDVPQGWALGIAGITYCTSIFQQYVTEVNADYFAVALSLFALTAYLKPNPKLIWIAFLCVIAFYTKFTTLYVPAAIFFSMLFHRDWIRAAIFAGLGIGMIAAGFWLFQNISDGRMWDSLSATSGAGTDWTYAANFLTRFLKELFVYAPAIGITVLVAIWISFTDRFLTWRHPVLLTFVFVLLGTLVTYTSKGIAGNHVIALHAVALIIIGRAPLGDQKSRFVLGAGLTILTLILVATWLPNVPSPTKTLVKRNNPAQTLIQAKIIEYAPNDGNILSIHAAYPIVAGRSVILLDTFNMQNFLSKETAAGHDLIKRISAKEFAMAIVDTDQNFGLQDHYIAVDQLGRYQILVPR